MYRGKKMFLKKLSNEGSGVREMTKTADKMSRSL